MLKLSMNKDFVLAYCCLLIDPGYFGMGPYDFGDYVKIGLPFP